MSDGNPWTTLGSVEPAALADAARELHWAVQYVASAGQTFVTPRDDDSHRSMVWNADVGAFLSDEFSEGYGFRVGVRPDGLTLMLVDRTDQVLGAQPLAGLTRDQGYEWIVNGLKNYMGQTVPEIGRPEYDMPDHAVNRGAAFRHAHLSEHRALHALYASGAEVLEGLVASRDDASPVRCWPHHFDIATLLTLREAEGDDPARTVGVGLSPYGGGYDIWYWYVGPYPRPEPHTLARLDAGHWHTEDWVGGVLTGDDVLAVEADGRRAFVEGFIDDAVGKATDALVG